MLTSCSLQTELNAPQAVITCEKTSNSTPSRLPQCIPMNPAEFGLVSSIYTLGGLLGALSAGPAAQKYGRLLTMRATSIFFILGPIFETLSSHIAVMVVGRLLSGVGAGAAIVVVPLYISEVSPPKERGFFGAWTQIMTCLGILIAQILGLFLSKGNYWRIILAVAGFIGVGQLVGLFFVPESPKWLAEHGKQSQARRILQKIRGSKTDIEPELKEWNAASTVAADEEEQQSLLPSDSQQHPPSSKSTDAPSTILGVIRSSQTRPAIIAVIVVMITQQFTGINSIIMYSVSLLSSILPTTAALLTVVVSAINLFVTVACAPLADKLGRRTCLLLSTAGMGLNAFLLAFGIMYSVQILSAIATLLLVASFGVGLGPVPFILSSELVAPEAVGATQSWALAANWIATFIVAQFFPVLNEKLDKGRVYFVFTALAVVLGSFLAWYLPETKGRSSADEVWGRKPVDRRED